MLRAAGEVLLQEARAWGVVTLNRPRALQALSLAMMEAVSEQLRTWRAEARPVLVRATPGGAFCVGGDLKEAVSRKVEMSWCTSLLAYLAASHPAPYVALMDGATMGSGCGLSVHARFRVATERTVLAMPEVAVGHFPDAGASHFLPRLPRRLGHLLGLTGHRLQGRAVLEAGLASHYCCSAALPGLQDRLLGLASPSSPAVQELLDELHPPADPPPSALPDLEDVERCFSPPTVEGVSLALRQLDRAWARRALRGMVAASPFALKLTKRLLADGAGLDLRRCLGLEHGLVARLASHEFCDFDEGVRAMFIDKDRSPRWRATLEDVTPDIVNSLFAFQPPDLDFDSKP